MRGKFDILSLTLVDSILLAVYFLYYSQFAKSLLGYGFIICPSVQGLTDPREGSYSGTRNEVVQQKPESEKESGKEAVVLDCGYFHKLTGCGDKGNTELS